MQTETLPYSEGDAAFDIFVARPVQAGPRPAVLVCHAWGGRDEFAEGRAKQLAELGYIGAAIDLYGVGRRGSDNASSQALMMELVGSPDLLRRRLAAAYATVRGLKDVDLNQMGAIGFCFGGLCALLMARMGLELRGVVSFHGLLKVGQRLDETVRAQMLILHGQDDPMVPAEDVAAFVEEMKRIHADFRLHAYPGAVHAFTNPKANAREAGMMFHAEAERRSWREMTHFFEEVFA